MKLLLDVCCGPCSTHVIKELKKDYELVLYFQNCNMNSSEEFEKRFINAKKVAEIEKIDIIKPAYNHKEWLEFVQGLENEPEGGKRCEKCFQYRFQKTKEYAKSHNIKFITTTLSVSPYKNSKLINEIGQSTVKDSDIEFVYSDFKKKDGYRHSIELSKEYDLYRQNYCGCEFSMSIESPKE